LPALHEIGHRPDRILDGHARVDSVLIEEIDVIDAETLQRGIRHRLHVLRPAVGPDNGRPLLRIDLEAELRGDDDLVALAFEGAADELLVLERAIDFSGIEEGHAELDRAVDGRDRFAFVGRAIGPAHPHAAEAERGNGKASRPKRACSACRYSLANGIEDGMWFR